MTTATASDARSVLKYVASLVVGWRWLIAISCVLVIGVAFAFFRLSGGPVSTGMTIIRIGLTPGIDYLLQGSGAPLAPIESNRDLVARISNSVFLAKVVGEAKFAPETADHSRQIASSSFRAVALEDARNVRLEVSAASRNDVAAILAAFAEQIASTHDAIVQRRLDALRSNTEDMRRRVDFLEKTVGEASQNVLRPPREGRDQAGDSVLLANVAEAVSSWNAMKDRVQRNTLLLEFSEKTVVHLEPGLVLTTDRMVAPAKAALLAGLAMFLAIVALVILSAPSSRVRGGRTET